MIDKLTGQRSERRLRAEGLKFNDMRVVEHH